MALPLRIDIIGDQPESRIMELPDHSFFVATLFTTDLNCRAAPPAAACVSSRRRQRSAGIRWLLGQPETR